MGQLPLFHVSSLGFPNSVVCLLLFLYFVFYVGTPNRAPKTNVEMSIEVLLVKLLSGERMGKKSIVSQW